MNRKWTAFTVMICFALSVAACLAAMMESEQTSAVRMLGKLCIAQVYPGSIVTEQESEEVEEAEQAEAQEEPQVTATVVKQTKKVETKKPAVDNSKPQVIIYHTHSSESYQPYTASNFHRQEEAGTVREVGGVMTSELNRLGISVVHDKTIHDSPSYNESYDRSLETVTALMKKYPTAKVIIDLHRDAAAYTGNVGETMMIEGEKTAKYKLVVGQNNDNYSQLMDFANKVNAAADKMYPGFSGRIIEKEYRYNEYIADEYLLLEVGNNQNHIKEVRKTGKYFARVLAKVLEEE